MNAAELRARLAAVEQRLEIHAARDTPTGLTDPEPGGTERWEAGQVWAHLAEFPAYWVGQLDRVIAGAAAGEREPIPFGRTRTDENRIAAIERDRHHAPGELLERVRSGIGQARETLDRHLTPAWETRGRHPTLGEMTAGRIIERFVVEHLEEHAAQLDQLAERAARIDATDATDRLPGGA